MACKYNNFTSAQLEEHIQKYARNYLSSSEEEEFEEHLLDCEECSNSAFAEIQLFRYSRQHLTFKKLEKALNEKKWNVVFSLAKKMRWLGYSENIFKVKEKVNSAKIGHAYEDLCAAYDEKDWKEVIRLGDQMEALGYSEEVHPIKEKLANSWRNIKLSLKPGEIVTGTVTQFYMDMVVILEIDSGIKGLLHISDMSWTKRVTHPREFVKIGETIDLAVKSVDDKKGCLYLSLRDLQEDPYISFPKKYSAGQIVEGKVVRKEKFGLLLTLDFGVVGLLPMSKLVDAGREYLFENIKIGDTLSVNIDSIESKERKIYLGVRDLKDEIYRNQFKKRKGEQIDSERESIPDHSKRPEDE